MSSNPKVSLIISFYNRVDFFLPVIASIANQSFKDFEIVISDDGSAADAVNTVTDILTKSGLNFQYVWHEDIGFRKNIILNKSVMAGRGEYLVFIDADCMLHRHFLSEHYNGRMAGVIRSGSRIDLSDKLTKRINFEKVNAGSLGLRLLFDQLVDIENRGYRGIEEGIYLGNTIFKYFLSRKDNRILGCNFGMFKADLVRLNGFDERFCKPGIGEDTDLEHRARRASLAIQSISKRAIEFHLYHPQLAREREVYDIFEENNRLKVTVTPYGITKFA